MICAGIDIGGTKCAAVLGKASEDGSFSILEKRVIPTVKDGSWKRTVDGVCTEMDGLLKEHEDVCAIGISCGGPLNSRTGEILSPPNLIGWDHVPIVRILEERYGVPAFIENDANACALAEWRFGAGKGCGNMIFLTFGTGLGAGLILNGRLYSGPDDMAGEAGHIRLAQYGPVGYGKAGSFEGFCSGGGIAQLAAARAREMLQTGKHPALCPSIGELDTLTARKVAEFAQKGDPLACRIMREVSEKLGEGLSVLIDLLNPDAIVIGSIYMRCEELMKDTVRSVIERECLPVPAARCEVRAAALGENLGDYAALAVGIDGLERRNTAG